MKRHRNVHYPQKKTPKSKAEKFRDSQIARFDNNLTIIKKALVQFQLDSATMPKDFILSAFEPSFSKVPSVNLISLPLSDLLYLSTIHKYVLSPKSIFKFSDKKIIITQAVVPVSYDFKTNKINLGLMQFNDVQMYPNKYGQGASFSFQTFLLNFEYGPVYLTRCDSNKLETFHFHPNFQENTLAQIDAGKFNYKTLTPIDLQKAFRCQVAGKYDADLSHKEFTDLNAQIFCIQDLHSKGIGLHNGMTMEFFLTQTKQGKQLLEQMKNDIYTYFTVQQPQTLAEEQARQRSLYEAMQEEKRPKPFTYEEIFGTEKPLTDKAKTPVTALVALTDREV